MPRITAIAERGAGPDLTDWPLLVWLKDEGVCTEDILIQVSRIQQQAQQDYTNAVIAERLGTTAEHVRQALSYLAAQRKGDA